MLLVRSTRTRDISDAIHFTLPPMVVNAQYSTADELLYEDINDFTLLPTYSTISETEAPNLPPRRETEKSLPEESICNGELTNKMIEDEYVEMQSKKAGELSPRYVQAPTLTNSDSHVSGGEEETGFNFEDFKNMNGGMS